MTLKPFLKVVAAALGIVAGILFLSDPELAEEAAAAASFAIAAGFAGDVV